MSPDPLEMPSRVDRDPADARVTAHRRRRPTGAAPPLPKQIGSTGWVWLILLVVVAAAGCLWLRADPGPLDRFDARITDAVTSVRTGWLDALARQAHTIGSRVGFAVLGLLLVLATGWFRRWRHLVIWMISLGLAGALLQGLELVALRPRPFGVLQLASWEGYATPSIPSGAIAILAIGVAFMLVVPGRARFWAKVAAAVAIAFTGVLRIYLGVDHFTDVLFGAIVGVAIPLALFRAFAPSDVFPISYGKHGKAAHLDVTGPRGEAIRTALQEQLGFTVRHIKPVGLEGSGGSTPLKLTVTDEEGRERTIFAKLYAKSHVRADRWYKLGRTMLYGRLEDETPFSTVRRFVEYEDYTLRMLGDYGFATPAALGVAEITPEREYLIAMDFFDDAREIGDAEIDGHVIDEGLSMIRRMWDVGLAHRDIKPANLMVQRGELKLIDVFFVQLRPSPWRQAVDLGNMMLVLALRSDADTVYDAAMRYFTPDELAEAFAATRGVASPTQLRQHLKQDGRDLLAEFRAMTPARRPISIQRWSMRRVALILASLALVLLVGLTGIGLLFPTRGTVTAPMCGAGPPMRLMAQAVPSATKLPCVASLPVGWSVGTAETIRGKSLFVIGVGDGSSDPVTVTFTASCPAPAEATKQIPIDGGCVTYRSSISDPDVPSFAPDGGLSFASRADLIAAVAADDDQVLCGALAPPCPQVGS
jgi:membrane-associated phospholipid phosphatase/tRNA A-37 threonylcarbamoyl transferase component Bud32